MTVDWSHSGTKKMNTLRETFEKFKSMPFPENPENDELYDIFSDLVQLDGHIAGLASSVLSGKIVDKELVFVDEEMNNRLNLINTNSRKEAKELLALRDYKRELDSLTNILLDLLENE